jgi:carboxymethylenebutenolidase
MIILGGLRSKKEINHFLNKKLMDRHTRNRRSDLGSIFDAHVKHEFIDHDVNATMNTMVKQPIVHHVPILTGGVGYRNVYSF